ncbi:MAG: hypothetical protein ABH986_06960 [archaeon]
MSLMERIELAVAVIIGAFFLLYFYLTGDYVGAITGLVNGMVPLLATVLSWVAGSTILVLIVIAGYLVLSKMK